jgi:hypothetical protein
MTTSLSPALRRPRMPAGMTQVAALVAIAAIGTAGLSVTTAATRAAQGRPATIGAATDRAAAGERVMTLPPASGRTRTAGRSRVTPPRTTHQPRRLAVASSNPGSARWIPTGTGIWVYQWGRTAQGNPRAIVRRALHTGLSHIFVRTGSSHDGFTGTTVLRALLPATRGTSLRVVAWDFPTLKNPVADARRLAKAASYRRTRGGPHVAAVAPDIETPAEGTHNSRRRVALYLTTLRRLLPTDVAILATVPWPSMYRVGSFPYGTVARYSDALLPMAYWYSNGVRQVTAQSISYLRRFHKPVQPVGQGYDSKIDVPSLSHSNLRRQVPVFLATAHRYGATAVSLWSWQTAPRVTWRALAAAGRLFPAQR